jgi:hypothetical protein
VGTGPREAEPLGHHYGPDALVTLAEVLYDELPPVFTVAVGARSFDDEGLSAVVAASIEHATAAVVELLGE